MTAGWQNLYLCPRQVLKMRMMVRLWEGEPAHCTLWLPLKQRSLGAVTLPTLHSWWSHALKPRSVWVQSCRVRKFSRLPFFLTLTASSVVPKTTLGFDRTHRTHWKLLNSWLQFITVKGCRLKDVHKISSRRVPWVSCQLSSPRGVMDRTTFSQTKQENYSSCWHLSPNVKACLGA